MTTSTSDMPRYIVADSPKVGPLPACQRNTAEAINRQFDQPDVRMASNCSFPRPDTRIAVIFPRGDGRFAPATAALLFMIDIFVCSPHPRPGQIGRESGRGAYKANSSDKCDWQSGAPAATLAFSDRRVARDLNRPRRIRNFAGNPPSSRDE
jgi:hypothetical protein